MVTSETMPLKRIQIIMDYNHSIGHSDDVYIIDASLSSVDSAIDEMMYNNSEHRRYTLVIQTHE
jgi:hypothetical protein